MPLLVKDLLRLQSFRDANAELLAGSGGLDGEVRWLHPLDLLPWPEYVHDALSGGEIVVVRESAPARNCAPATDPLWVRHIDALSLAGASGLIIEVADGREVRRKTLDAANRRNLPLIAIKIFPTIRLTEEVHRLLVDETIEDLRKVDELLEKLNSALLNGDGVTTVIGLIASAIGAPLVIEDTARRVIAVGTAGEDLGGLLSAWEHHSRRSHQTVQDESALTREVDPEPPCWWSALHIRGARWGRAHLLETQGPLSQRQLSLFKRVLNVVLLSITSEAQTSVLMRRQCDTLIEEALRGELTTHNLRRRAYAIGAPLGARLQAIAIEPESDWDPDASGLEQCVAALDRNLRATGVSAIIGISGPQLVVILADPDAVDIESLAKQLLLDVSEYTSHRARIGVSAAVDAAAYREALDQTSIALRSGARSEPALEDVVFYERLGAGKLLLRLADDPALASFIEEALGPLLDHDAEGVNPLLPTLRCYVRLSGQKTAAARALFIERRSLYHRLQRIESTLDANLDDPEVRETISLAITAFDVLGGQMGNGDRRRVADNGGRVGRV